MYIYQVLARVNEEQVRKEFTCQNSDQIENTYESALEYFAEYVQKLTPNITDVDLGKAMAHTYYHSPNGFVALTELTNSM
jgi:hypothetical protein